MARKAHDLFDVFQLAQDAGSGNRKHGPRRKAAPASAAKTQRARTPAARRKSGASAGLALNRRQVLLAGSALMLLLVLSFTLGLATGRPGSKQANPSLDRRSAFVIRGTLPLTDPTTRNPVDTQHIRRQLSRDYKIPGPNIMMRRLGNDLRIDIGPWPSKRAAKRFWNRSGLKLVHIHLEDPFRWAQVVPYRPPP